MPEELICDYPEAFVYGRALGGKGIYFRHVEGLTLDNVTAKAYRKDYREYFLRNVKSIKKVATKW